MADWSVKLGREITRLEREIDHLRRENAELKETNDTWDRSYHELQDAVVGAARDTVGTDDSRGSFDLLERMVKADAELRERADQQQALARAVMGQLSTLEERYARLRDAAREVYQNVAMKPEFGEPPSVRRLREALAACEHGEEGEDG